MYSLDYLTLLNIFAVFCFVMCIYLAKFHGSKIKQCAALTAALGGYNQPVFQKPMASPSSGLLYGLIPSLLRVYISTRPGLMVGCEPGNLMGRVRRLL
jgi:hypothetical protein